VRNDAGDERLRVPLLKNFHGKIEAPPSLAEGQPSLVARAPFGLGEVVYVAADLDQRPFSDWSGRTNLLRRVARHRLSGETDVATSTAARGPLQHDLVEQLQRAMDEFPGVQVVPFYWVAILVLGYLALIGPADFRLQRLWKRMEWTWITFPLMVVLAAWGVYQFARWLKGGERHINQVNIVDVDVSGYVRGTTIANLFSPQMVTYDVAVRPGVAPSVTLKNPQVTMSGFALAPAALVGQSDRTAVTALSADEYRFAPRLDRLEGLPWHVWSSRSVMSEWRGTVDPLVESSLIPGRDFQLKGELKLLTNVKLEDCWLVYGNSVARLGELTPGTVINVGARDRVDWGTLSTQLRYQRREQKAPGKDEFGVVGTQWDLESTNVREIIRQILFYDAAGRSSYTRSWNGPLRKLDLSQRRDLGEAMLVGFISDGTANAAGAAQLIHGEEPLVGAGDRHWNVLRCLLPVATAEKTN
jgi:hypothetical protein